LLRANENSKLDFQLVFGLVALGCWRSGVRRARRVAPAKLADRQPNSFLSSVQFTNNNMLPFGIGERKYMDCLLIRLSANEFGSLIGFFLQTIIMFPFGIAERKHMDCFLLCCRLADGIKKKVCFQKQ
jgi:hypothetical protein